MEGRLYNEIIKKRNSELQYSRYKKENGDDWDNDYYGRREKHLNSARFLTFLETLKEVDEEYEGEVIANYITSVDIK